MLQQFLTEFHSGKGINVKTSGSTGEPKPIVLDNSTVIRSASRTNRFFGITKKSRLHSAISFEYIGGKMMIARSLTAGCQLTYTEPSLTPEIPNCNEKVDLMSVVPAQMPHIIENIEKYTNVRNFLLGGSKIEDQLWDKIVSSGVNAWESYGMTETASHIALRRIAGPSWKRPKFVPLPGVEISCDHEECLVINDANHVIKTRDLVRIHPGNTFEILGRKDNIIISGGIKMNPEEIEQVIRPYIREITDEFFITSVPDAKWTEKLIIVAAPLEIEGDRIMKTIEAIPETELPKRKKPKGIKLMESLPLTPTGKLKRRLGPD